MIRGNAILTSHIKLPMTFIIILLGFSSVSACTALCLGDSSRVYIAKNYDWNVESGIIVINKRNVAKSALAEPNPARWISRYGSVTFNQYGREQPSGGINEAGLVVEVLWLQETDYPPPGDRGVVSELQWIQYQLDNYSKVDEVIASDSLISINGGNKARVHYFVGDAGGECAVVEFIDGERVAHNGESCPIRAITNNTYDESISYATGFSRFGGKLPVQGTQPGDRDVQKFILA